MFTIKVMSDNSHDYTMHECQEFTVQRNATPSGVGILIPTDGEGPAARVIEVRTMAYVMNAQGKTVDVIYGRTEELATSPRVR